MTMLTIIIGSTADFIWSLLRCMVAALALALFVYGLLAFGLFALATIPDNPPFEIIPRRW